MRRHLALIEAALTLAVMVLGVDLGLAVQDSKVSAQQAMTSIDYLVGTWGCAHSVGTFSGKYTTTYSKVLGGLWLKQTYDFPAQQTSERKEPRITAEALMGYDERHQAWVRFFANSLGETFPLRMKDTGSGWAFKYISFFAPTADTTQPDATFTKKSNTEYTVDGPTYPENGSLVTEHHTCHKL